MTRSSSGTRYARACCRTQLSNQDARAPIATCFQPRRPCLGSIWITNVMRKHQSSHVIIKCSFAALASIRLVEEGTKERHSRLGRLAWLRITTRRRTSPSSQCSAVRAGKCGGTLVAEWQCDAATRSAIVPGCGVAASRSSWVAQNVSWISDLTGDPCRLFCGVTWSSQLLGPRTWSSQLRDPGSSGRSAVFWTLPTLPQAGTDSQRA